MSIRTAVVCAIIVLAGCDTREVVNTVQHQSAWQRQAGESPQETARLAAQCNKNTEELLKKLQANDTKELGETMRGKLVKLDGEVTDQTDSMWMLRNKDGWTIIAVVNDLTPHSDVRKDRMQSCWAQGIVDRVDAQNRKITLKDVELTPEMKAGT